MSFIEKRDAKGRSKNTVTPRTKVSKPPNQKRLHLVEIPRSESVVVESLHAVTPLGAMEGNSSMRKQREKRDLLRDRFGISAEECIGRATKTHV